MSKIKILFFTNNLNRTGAEVVLFNLICRLDPIQFQIGIVVVGELGQLISELPKHIDHYQLKVKYNLFEKVQHYFGRDLLSDQLSEIQDKGQYSIWYVNSLSPTFVLKYAKPFILLLRFVIFMNCLRIIHICQMMILLMYYNPML
jgi:hypothetical protein